MKKITFGLLVTTLTLLFSSCIVVSDDTFDDCPFRTHYDFTFINNTDYKVGDWYLRTEYGKKYAKSSDYEQINSGRKSTIYNVPKNDYQVYFAYSSNIKQYLYTNYFTLDTDTKYYLQEDRFYERSAIASNSETGNEAPVLYIVDDKGNRIELFPVEEE